jgi:O-antigen ligase
MSAWHDQYPRILNIDLFTILIVILLWLCALIPSIAVRSFLRSLICPICILPIAFFALARIGTLWSDAPWTERLYAVGPTVKLPMLPSLLYHFERATRATWIFIAFLGSCSLLSGYDSGTKVRSTPVRPS